MRIALGIEYNGVKYHGWQSQKNVITVQGVLEKCLSIIANENIIVYCAGRTDAKVHSIGQVIHFDTSSVRKEKSWILGTNFYLPKDISVKWAKIVSYKFHARYSAIYRHYRYIINNSDYKSVFFTDNFYNFNKKFLNVKKMNLSIQCLIGEHNFSSFRSKSCQSKISYRYVFSAKVYRINSFVIFDIVANSFLHNMVRNIVTSLIQIGSDEKKVFWIEELLLMQNNNFTYSTSNPIGLYLIYVKYPRFLNFPKFLYGNSIKIFSNY
ncbi:tRNA pseudouridine(38-40) synthase TruA [Buchnera aphidicola (Chaitoregma tattakana)]|uniref:tRNA pseudouridine(38-40) synthase TruA n=1 Tax=Buchnera aphidicola TaxID=9 RepID=UPI0031B885DB